MRLCEHAAAFVQWDECFGYADSHVPLNPRKYEKEGEFNGWNVLKPQYVAAKASIEKAAKAEEDAQRQENARSCALLDLGV